MEVSYFSYHFLCGSIRLSFNAGVSYLFLIMDATEKVGHVKATMAKSLAAIMDNGNARLEGTIPRAGNAYTLPLLLDFYSNNAIPDEAAATAAENLKAELKRRGDSHFTLSPEFAPVSSKSSKKLIQAATSGFVEQ